MKHIVGLILITMLSCSQKNNSSTTDIQGHRGARGLMPENSIPGFVMAAEMGVTTLEMDVVIAGDSQVVVSHEPFFSPEICLDPEGNTIADDSIINIYQLPYHEISRFDCGSLPHARFPEQKKIPTKKPLLSAVIDTIEALDRDPLRYNIELKSRVDTDKIYHPVPHEFVRLVMNLIVKKGIVNRVTIQSFDFRILQVMAKEYPEISLALLIENELSWEVNIDSLGFTPAIYSPYYKLLSRERVKNLQMAGMQVIPWTINEKNEIEEVLSWKVDGIISDYPDRVIEVIKKTK